MVKNLRQIVVWRKWEEVIRRIIRMILVINYKESMVKHLMKL